MNPFKKNLESILGQFTKTLDNLEQLMAKNAAKIQKNDDKVSKLNAKSADLHAESSKALAAATKLRELIAE